MRVYITSLALLLLALAAPTLAVVASAPNTLYLPLVAGSLAGTGPASAPRVNAPYYPVTNLDRRFGELAIFWFGAVTPTRNYADVRIGHNDTELYVYVAVFDRRLWYDYSPEVTDLDAWDAVTLFLDPAPASSLDASSHQFVAQLSGDGGSAYQAAYRASRGSWSAATTPFTTRPGWRGEQLNDDTDDRGWAMTFRVPFASLGLSERPSLGTTWRMAVVLHDRDDLAGSPIVDQVWPPGANLSAPLSWGTLGFGVPGYTPPTTTSREIIVIRQGLGGAVVPDAAVGGGTVCGDGLDFWREWGESTRDAGKGDFNVQNQSDVADWPCFSKYFVTFPLNTLPPGRAVVAASLVLHQFGNSDPSQARPSLIQVQTISENWTEQTLSWNNAPLATENVGSGWVDPLVGAPDWPGVRRELDVTRAVANAYALGGPLRLALYSADSDYHSGKYFVTSDTGDWNVVARPTLIVTLGTPVRASTPR